MSNDLKQTVLEQLQTAAKPVATALGMQQLIPVDLTGLGNLPWFWQNGLRFNAKTFNWLNHLFAFKEGTYAGTDGSTLTTALLNVLNATAYKLNDTDSNTLNEAINANQATVNTLIKDWASTQGPLPSTDITAAAQLNYISNQVLSWGAPGLTLQTFRKSLNPLALINPPIGGDKIAQDFITYLAKTSSVAGIQAAVLTYNTEVQQVVGNIAPQPPLTTATPGYMTLVDDGGTSSVNIAIDIAEAVADLQNNLAAAPGTGKTFSASFHVIKQADNSVQVSAEGGAAGAGDLFFFLTLAGEGGAKYNLFSADGSVEECDITLTYSGVTTLTPTFYGYDVNSGTGWWYPKPISDAASGNSDVSGYRFMPVPNYDFDTNGTFGAIGRLLVAQQPVIKISYSTSNYQEYKKTFDQESAWELSFLGIPLAAGGESSHHSESSFDSNSNTVTVTMTPVASSTPVATTDQLATVVGVEMLWPGAVAQA